MAIDISAIDKEIESGLPCHQGRLLAAKRQYDTYIGDFKKSTSDNFLSPQHWDDGRTSRHLLLMHKIVRSLTCNLYKTPPTRIVPDNPGATAVLEKVYKQNRVDALLRQADEVCHACGEYAFQVVGTDEPMAPVRIHAWLPGNFCVFTEPGDPLKVAAVCTIDMAGQRTRYRLYTADQTVTYMTKVPLDGYQGDELPQRASVEPNPYVYEGKGVIPFAFAHHDTPTISWHTGGPGATLSEMNRHVNFRLSDLADAMRYARPQASLEGVDPSGSVPKWVRMGDYLNLPAVVSQAGQTPVTPRLNFTGPSLEFIQREWDDLNNYVDLTLQTIGVPPNTLRLKPSATASGVALVAEHIPLILYAKNRQHLALQWEEELAEVVLKVLAAHLANNGRSVPAVNEALRDFGLVVRYADPFPDLPGQDRDLADTWLLQNSLTTRIDILMRREGLSHEEAVAKLEQIAKDKEIEAAILGVEEPQAPATDQTEEPVEDAVTSTDEGQQQRDFVEGAPSPNNTTGDLNA